MNPLTPELLHARLERLERINRSLRNWLFFTLVLCGAAVVLGFVQSLPNTIRARRFELLDDAGTVRAVMAQDKNRTVFRLQDRNGRTGLNVQIGDDWRWLELLDRTGKPQAGMRTDGKGRFYMADGSGKVRADVVVDDVGPRLRLFDSDQALRAQVLSGVSGDAWLEMLDGKGNVESRFPRR